MSIRGITFVNQIVKSDDDASLHNMLLSGRSGVMKGCATTFDSSHIYVASGQFVILGRQIEVQGTETITPDVVNEGKVYCRLVFEVDLSKTNTTEVFGQGYFRVLSSSISYPGVTQEDLIAGGTIYQYPWARFTQTIEGIADFANETTTLRFAVDDELSATSENPVQNKAVYKGITNITNGTTPAGDSKKLGGKGAETWQGEIEDIKTVTRKQLTAKGWYRIATGKDVSSSSVISIRNWHGSGGGEDIALLYQCTIASSTYNNAKISTLGSTSSNNNVIFTDVRVVRTADGTGVDVYYNRDGANSCFFGLLNLHSDSNWRICEPTLVETEPTESDIVIQYSIPKDVQAALNTDLANYLPLSAAQSTIESPTNDTPLNLKAAGSQSTYLGFINKDGTRNYIGFNNEGDAYVYKKGKLLHTGNSAKVAIQSTAPSDQTAVWVW